MNNLYLKNQLEEAYYNYNYFFMKMIVKILQACFKLACVLLISEIFNYTIINILAIIYTVISFLKFYSIFNRYNYLIKDIKNTLGIKEIKFEIDLDTISDNLFKGMLSYGK